MHGSMIDMHCHFLPGLDDGAPDLETALEMARVAVADGIRFAVLTPHIEPGLHDNHKAVIRGCYESFRRELRLARIPLRVFMGSEVRMDLAVIPMFGREEIPFLGVMNGYEIVLLELPPGYVPVGAARYVERLMRQRIRPIIAHPERHTDIIRDPSILDPLLAAGSFLQLNAGSLTGDFGRAVRRRARQLLSLRVFKVLASDAHDLHTRRPILSRAVEVAADVVGPQEALALVYHNPAAIVFGKRLATRRLDRRQLLAAGLDLRPGAPLRR
jgi:protein-tyrosine phosphatase